jgi:cysteine desulfurase
LLAVGAIGVSTPHGEQARRLYDSLNTMVPTDEITMTPIYLDYNATTPLDPAVVEAMLPYLHTHFGNPSSTHLYGTTAHEAVDRARAQVAALIGAQPEEIVLTGGGSEASNHALKGAVFAKLQGFFGRWARGAHIVTGTIEHPATLQPCAFLERLGAKVTKVGVDHQGLVDPDSVKRALERGTTIVSIMHSNNEVGTLQPIREIAVAARERGVLVHTDAAQSLGKLRVDVNELGVDLLSIAGHKLYAPKGIGVLYIRKGVKLEPFIHGAGHEGGRRAGTENVPYIVALGMACDIARQSLPEATNKLRRLRDRLWEMLRAGLGDRVVLNGHPELRLPSTLNVNFIGHIGAELLRKTPEIAASTGSACHEGHIALSPVLCAMGVRPEIGKGAVRLTVGRFTTEDEVDRAAEVLVRAAL